MEDSDDDAGFGIKTSPQHTTYHAMLKVWEEAEEIPIIEHAWLLDHFAPIQGDVNGPCLEGERSRVSSDTQGVGSGYELRSDPRKA